MTTILDVSGSHGANGINGRHAAIYSGRSKDGNHGSDATNPTKGIDAGGNGARGSPGIDATRYTSGTNGGRGGDGGDAGAGTSGADGGSGGTITLRVNDTDAGLLILFVTSWTPSIYYSLNVNGGKGGSGGPGGRGGSSYSWSETTYSTNYRGDRIAHTNYYTNPGSDGIRPSIPLYNGTSGANGVMRFLIKDSVTEYYEIFDIRLHKVITHSVTGVYEPEAHIIIDDLT
ncbi:10089_t:CDS:2, partial [Scutellospora calospora]